MESPAYGSQRHATCSPHPSSALRGTHARRHTRARKRTQCANQGRDIPTLVREFRFQLPYESLTRCHGLWGPHSGSCGASDAAHATTRDQTLQSSSTASRVLQLRVILHEAHDDPRSRAAEGMCAGATRAHEPSRLCTHTPLSPISLLSLYLYLYLYLYIYVYIYISPRGRHGLRKRVERLDPLSESQSFPAPRDAPQMVKPGWSNHCTYIYIWSNPQRSNPDGQITIYIYGQIHNGQTRLVKSRFDGSESGRFGRAAAPRRASRRSCTRPPRTSPRRRAAAPARPTPSCRCACGPGRAGTGRR